MVDVALENRKDEDLEMMRIWIKRRKVDQPSLSSFPFLTWLGRWLWQSMTPSGGRNPPPTSSAQVSTRKKERPMVQPAWKGKSDGDVRAVSRPRKLSHPTGFHSHLCHALDHELDGWVPVQRPVQHAGAVGGGRAGPGGLIVRGRGGLRRGEVGRITCCARRCFWCGRG